MRGCACHTTQFAHHGRACILLHGMNPSTLLTLAMSILAVSGQGAVELAFHVPDSLVEQACAKTGADLQIALADRDKMANDWAAFIVDLAGVHATPQVAHDMGLSGTTIAADQSAHLSSVEVSIINVALMLYHAFGRSFVTRLLTPPASAIAAICAKTGANTTEAMAACNQAVSDFLDFIEACVTPAA